MAEGGTGMSGFAGGKRAAARIARFCMKALAFLALLLVVFLAAFGLIIRQASFRKTPYEHVFRSDPAILRSHVDFMCGKCPDRNYANPVNLNKAANYIEKTFSIYSRKVEKQSWEGTDNSLRNIIAGFGPEKGRTLVIGAHYDVYGDIKGADDNASGVAGLLELSRLFSQKAPEIPVQIVAYPNMEPPFFAGAQMGSVIHARSLIEKGVTTRGMISLDMIGYFSEKQRWPYLLINLIYPSRGDFIVIAGRWKDRGLSGDLKAGIRGAGGVRAVSYNGPVIIGVELSDHRSYWDNGCPAVLVTDTAFMRNENYHTARDVPELLDYDKMASVVDGVYNTAMSFKR